MSLCRNLIICPISAAGLTPPRFPGGRRGLRSLGLETTDDVTLNRQGVSELEMQWTTECPGMHVTTRRDA